MADFSRRLDKHITFTLYYWRDLYVTYIVISASSNPEIFENVFVHHCQYMFYEYNKGTKLIYKIFYVLFPCLC